MGQFHSAADCSDGVAFPTSAPTYSNAPTTSTTLYRGYLPWCGETTCDGVDSPLADGGTYSPSTSPMTVPPATAEPSMSPVFVSDIPSSYNPSKSPVTAAPVTVEPSMSPSSSSIATLNILLILLTISFAF